MKESLIKIIETKENFNWTFHDIKRALNLSKRKINDELLKVLKELEKEGIIYEDEKGIYHKFPSNFVIATIRENKSGKYSADTDLKTYGIDNDKLNGALSGDVVILDAGFKKNTKVVKILIRKHKRLVCEVKINSDSKKYLEPYNVSQKFNVSIGYHNYRRLTVGQRILVELSDEKYGDYYDGKYIETIGYKDDPDIDLQCIAVSNGFNLKFPDEVLEEVQSMPIGVSAKDFEGRIDLTSKEIFTIDGEHTKDMDDAISLEMLDNGNYLLGVHIAHVSSYIKPGSKLWNEAVIRGNSLYLLDSVIPMVPQYLSNGLCSLNEGENRLTRSVMMEIDNEGNVVSYKIFKSVINSKKKMSYEKVNEYFKTGIIPNGYEKFNNTLDLMNELSYILSKKRETRGSIDFATSEVVFSIDENGIVTSSCVRESEDAEKLIENFMVTANCVVAEHVFYQRLPFAYRNHGVPNDDRLQRVIETLKTMGYHLEKVTNISSPEAIQKILKELSNKEAYPVLSTFVLRAMQKAEYNSQNYGHFGLSVKCYTHFTSPIRRLIDLVIHTLLDYYENSDNSINIKVIDTLMKELDNICQRATLQEKAADKAEYQAYKLASVEMMQDKIGNKFEVFVTDIKPGEITIKTRDLIEGIIPLNLIGADYSYNPDNKTIKLNDINKHIVLGSKICVNLIEASLEYRELYFTFNHLYRENLRQRRLEKFSE